MFCILISPLAPLSPCPPLPPLPLSASHSPGVEALAIAKTILPPTPVLNVPLHLHVCVVDMVHKCVYTAKRLVTLSPATLTWLGQQSRVHRRQLERQKTARKCCKVEVNVNYLVYTVQSFHNCSQCVTLHSAVTCLCSMIIYKG